MTTPKTLTVSYALSIPQGTNAPSSSLKPSAEHTFVIEPVYPAKTRVSDRDYYEGLCQSMAMAKEQLGEELTAWRDAVGNAEAGKENAVKAARAEEEEGDDQDEE